MTEPVSKRPVRFSTLRVLAVLAVVLGPFAFLLFGPIFLGTRRFLVIQELLFGWWSFAERTVPLITLNWDLLGTAAVCVFGVLGLSHVLLRRLACWRLRSTLALNGLVWLSFFTATAVAGLVEQTRWLRAANHEPLLVVTKWGTRANHLVRSFSWEVEHRCRDGMTLENAIAAFRQDNSVAFIPPKGRYRDFRVFCLVDATNGYAGMIVFRRPEIVHPDHLVAIHQPDSSATEHPREALPRLLSQPGLTAVPIF